MIMQEEQIREALNKHWHASAAGDANAEHDIYADDAILRLSVVRGANPRAKQSAGLAESSSRQAVRFQRQANSRKRRPLDHGMHNHLPGGTSVHSEHYGVPQ